MRAIYKYALDITDEQTVHAPIERVLSVAEQHGSLCAWALVDLDKPNTVTTFRIYGTGHPAEDTDGAFVGTVVMHGGALVWHVFVKIEGWAVGVTT